MTIAEEAGFTNLAPERACLVGVKLKSERDGWSVEGSLEELAQLGDPRSTAADAAASSSVR